MFSRFELVKNKTSLNTEIIAGASSFLAMAYIIVVNPTVLSQTGMPFSAVLTATVIVCFVSSCMMGWLDSLVIGYAGRSKPVCFFGIGGSFYPFWWRR